MTARITYRTSSSNPSAPKVDGKAISLNSVIDGAIADSYEHSFYFELTDQNIESLMSGEGIFSFVLNLADMSLSDFPPSFLVEFYSKGNDSSKPFIFAHSFSFEISEKQDDPPAPLETYTITLDPNGGTVEYTTKEYNAETEDFSIPIPNRDGYDFTGWTGSNGDTPQKEE